MTSTRNNIDDPKGANKTDRLLDAARASIMTVGWTRTTLTDVARRAGVSRMTVYRTYPDMSAMLGDLMTREWEEATATVLADNTGLADNTVLADNTGPAGKSHAEGASAVIGGQVARAVAALRNNDLFRRIIDVDPELLLPYLLDRRGRSQDDLLAILTDRIAQGQADGVLRAGQAQLLARTVMLTAQGFTLSSPTMADSGVAEADLDAQLADLVGRYLAP